jgi:hypothetical protein
MAAINEHDKLNAPGTPVLQDGVEGCAGCAASEYDVVDEDDVAVRYIQIMGRGGRRVKLRTIIPEWCNTQGMCTHSAVRDSTHFFRHGVGQEHATFADAEEQRRFHPSVALDDFAGKTAERTLDLLRRHDARLGHEELGRMQEME